MRERYEQLIVNHSKQNSNTVLNEAAAIEVGGKVITPKTLPSSIEKAIDERIGDEYTAHYFYRNAANWCKGANYAKAAAFFDAEANSELEHAKGLQDYLTQWNLLPAIPAAPTKKSFKSLIEIVNGAYEMEYGLLEKYSENQTEFFKEHIPSFNFIQDYVDIQNQAVGEYSDLLNALELIDVNDKLNVLYFENNFFG
jgi:ferritin